MTFEARDNAAKVVPSAGWSEGAEDRKSARKLKVNSVADTGEEFLLLFAWRRLFGLHHRNPTARLP